MLSASASSSAAWRAMGQRGDGRRIRLGRRLHAVLRRAHLGPGVPRQQRQQLVAQAHAFELQEIPAQVRARVQVHVHRIAGERAHEQAGGPDRQGFAGALERQTVREGLREHPRDLRVGVARGDRLAQRGRSPASPPGSCGTRAGASGARTPRAAARCPAAAGGVGNRLTYRTAGRIRNGVCSRPSQSSARHVNMGKMK